MSSVNTNVFRFLAVLETSWGTLNRLKTTWRHPHGTPILPPKAILLRSEPREHNFRRCCPPKRLFWKSFSAVFCILNVFYQQQPFKLQDMMCLATVRLARHRSSSSSSSSSSLARHVMSCNILTCKSQQKQQ